ncbi:MAG: AAA family ATPase, partial [Oligoflexia bacterium]|nr:AAA family ATPase [Oligoflexia bacterium]
MKGNIPLAERFRPGNFDEFFGQEHLVGKDRLLRKAIEDGTFGSCIFWGPPGCGKTSLAQVVANVTERPFVLFSAVLQGVSDVRQIVSEADMHLRMYGRNIILFIDEIHRFNKAQQDALLPHVEKGTITLIGATTENPSFEINSALLSRCQVFVLEALSNENIASIIDRVLGDGERGLASYKPRLDDDAYD